MIEYLAAGGDLQGRDWLGRTLLHITVDLNSNARRQKHVHLLLKKGIEVNAKDKTGATALHYARSTKMVDLLIAHGADVNAQTIQGTTILHSTVKKNRVEMVKRLITKGANLNLQDHQGRTPLHIATTEEIATLLMNSGADPKKRDRQDSTFLHHAVKHHWLEILKHLNNQEIDFNVSNHKGLTPLYFVIVEHPSIPIASFLVTNGAKF